MFDVLVTIMAKFALRGIRRPCQVPHPLREDGSSQQSSQMSPNRRINKFQDQETSGVTIRLLSSLEVFAAR
jgi:hypothetical protein